jgi:hypothetical protein
MLATTRSLTIEPVDFSVWMLDPEDQYVKDELARRQEENLKDKSMQDSAWVSDAAKLLRKSNMSWSECVAPKDQCDSPWFALLPEREKFALAYTMKHSPAAKIIDTSQSAGRCCTSDGTRVFALLPRSKPWHLDHKRPVLGKEMLMCHGMPPKFLDPAKLQAHGFSDPFLRDLAGNSVVAEAFASMLIGAMLHWPAKAAAAASSAAAAAPSAAAAAPSRAPSEDSDDDTKMADACIILGVRGTKQESLWW